ncbi:MAG: T9SS type A sorting domain-containing protein [Bacteroidia bacterium]
MNNLKSNSKIFISLLILCISFNLKANSQVVPNGSFENWTQQIIGAQTVLTADNWAGSYTQGSTPPSPIQTTDHIDGIYGIEIETTQWPIVGKTGGIVACTFPIATKPLYINGFFKSVRVDTTGTGQVLIRLKNNGTLIGAGLFTTNTNVNNYTLFSQAITYTSNLIPDEATIWLCSEGIFGVNTKNFGNKLWIDNLSLSSSPLSIDNNLSNEEFFLMFPNPSRDVLNVILKNHSTASLVISNELGQTLMTEKLENKKNTINISSLKSGVYVVQLEIEDKKFVKKIIKE